MGIGSVTAQTADEVHAPERDFEERRSQAENGSFTRSAIEGGSAVRQVIDTSEFVGGVTAQGAGKVFAFEDFDEVFCEEEVAYIERGLDEPREPGGIGVR